MQKLDPMGLREYTSMSKYKTLMHKIYIQCIKLYIKEPILTLFKLTNNKTNKTNKTQTKILKRTTHNISTKRINTNYKTINQKHKTHGYKNKEQKHRISFKR